VRSMLRKLVAWYMHLLDRGILSRPRDVVAWLIFILVVPGSVFAFISMGRGENSSAAEPIPTLEARSDSQPYGVFEGRIPCGDCERIKVRLTLHRNPANNAATEYLLERIYVGKGNDRETTRGTWKTVDAPLPDRYGVAYRLDQTSPVDFSFYMPVGANLLLFLNEDLQPRVGDASHSFTLSRTR
jgi:hypothetical protein